MSKNVDGPLATEEDERQVIILATRDLQNTLGPGYENIAQSHASRLREFGTAEDYVERVVNNVQQEIHDEFIDTSWPRCPRHPHAPLWFRDGGWWCEHDGELIAALGSLPASRVSNTSPVR